MIARPCKQHPSTMAVQRNRGKEGTRKPDGGKLRMVATRIVKAAHRGARQRRSTAAAAHKLGSGFVVNDASCRRLTAGDLVLAKCFNWPM